MIVNAPTLHRGKLATQPKVSAVRPLTREDMLRLKGPRPPQNRPKLMRQAHHELARYVAVGMPVNEILALTGYSSARYYTLIRDPAFEQLVTLYREKDNESWIRSRDAFHDASLSNMLRGERKIEQILDDDDDGLLEKPLTINQLMALTADRADRFGYGKKSTQRNENLDFAAMMEQIARASGRSNVIDAKASPAPARLVSDVDDGGTDG